MILKAKVKCLILKENTNILPSQTQIKRGLYLGEIAGAICNTMIFKRKKEKKK